MAWCHSAPCSAAAAAAASSSATAASAAASAASRAASASAMAAADVASSSDETLPAGFCCTWAGGSNTTAVAAATRLRAACLRAVCQAIAFSFNTPAFEERWAPQQSQSTLPSNTSAPGAATRTNRLARRIELVARSPGGVQGLHPRGEAALKVAHPQGLYEVVLRAQRQAHALRNRRHTRLA